MGFLGAEGGCNAKDVAEGGEAGFEVELGGLGEISFFAVVIEGEESSAAFDLRLHHTGRRDFEAARRDFFVGLPEGT